jgi:hypothetical protein
MAGDCVEYFLTEEVNEAPTARGRGKGRKKIIAALLCGCLHRLAMSEHDAAKVIGLLVLVYMLTLMMLGAFSSDQPTGGR